MESSVRDEQNTLTWHCLLLSGIVQCLRAQHDAERSDERQLSDPK